MSAMGEVYAILSEIVEKHTGISDEDIMTKGEIPTVQICPSCLLDMLLETFSEGMKFQIKRATSHSLVPSQN